MPTDNITCIYYLINPSIHRFYNNGYLETNNEIRALLVTDAILLEPAAENRVVLQFTTENKLQAIDRTTLINELRSCQKLKTRRVFPLSVVS